MRGLGLRSGQESWRSILALLRFVRLERKVLNKGELKARLPERGRAEREIEMAKALKSKGVDIGIIAETSGLSAEEIEKL